jgi:hypothetical protein
MQLLGDKDIRMTLRYTQVTQQDIQREFHRACQNVTHPHRRPKLARPKGTYSANLPGIRQALTATRHFLEMYRRQVVDEKAKRKLQSLDRRLFAGTSQLNRITTAEKWGKIGR